MLLKVSMLLMSAKWSFCLFFFFFLIICPWKFCLSTMSVDMQKAPLLWELAQAGEIFLLSWGQHNFQRSYLMEMSHLFGTL